MNETRCRAVRELLPELAAEALSRADAEAVEAHLTTCEACRSEMEIVRLLRLSRPSVPADLAPRIRGTVRFRRKVAAHPWWGVAAAAVAALAIGIGVVAQRAEMTQTSVPAYVAEPAQSDVWLANDGLVAGGPVLNGLSDQALEELLKEMGQWRTGT
jgi:predicted anti-sigma-YlaC factor YlaD